MSNLVVETPEGLALRFEVAGAGSRSAAAAIDVSLWALALLTALLFVQVVLGGLGGLGIVIGAGLVVSLVLYHAVFGVVWHGQTPGKRVLGIGVVDESGLGATPGQHVLRALFWPFEALIMVPVPLGIVMMAATSSHQRLGDRVAGTVVLRRPNRRLPAQAFPRERWSELPNRVLPLVPAHAARFDGGDLAFLGELLGRSGIEAPSRARLLRRSAQHFVARLRLESAPPCDSPADARRVLAELYLFLREARERRALLGEGERPNS